MPTYELQSEQLATRFDYKELMLAVAKHAEEVDQMGTFPHASLDVLRGTSVLGILIPREYGGLGGTIQEFTRIAEALAQGCVSTAAVYLFHAQVAKRIVDFGTDAQKQEILPRMARGEWLGASSWSELTAGSDKSDTKSIAMSQDEHLLVNGRKAYCTGAGEADVYTVLVRTGAEEDGALSFVLLFKDDEGIDFGQPWDGMGMRASSTKEIVCDNLRIPADRLLGGVPGLGTRMMAVNRGTAIHPGILSLGIVKSALAILKEQLALKPNLWTFQNTRMVMSDLLIRIHTLELLIYKAAEFADRGDERSAQMTMEAKILGATTGVNVTDMVMQLCGAQGYNRGSKIERLYRDARAIGLMGPTTELSREYMMSDWRKKGELSWQESILIF